MNETELRSLVERMVAELAGQASSSGKATSYKQAEHGSAVSGEMLQDITEIDLRKQYLVKNPYNATAVFGTEGQKPPPAWAWAVPVLAIRPRPCFA